MRRLTTFVSMASAARELEISQGCFRIWVRDGVLPPPEPGFPVSNRRWRWSTIDAWLAGDRSTVPASQADLFARKPRGPRPGHGGRPRKPAPGLDDDEMEVER
jgi:hypothetical protein